MKLSQLFSKLKLKFNDPSEEVEYHKIKRPLLKELFKWLLGCGALAMLTLTIYFFIKDRFVEGGITIFMLVAPILAIFAKKFVSKFMEYSVVGYLLVVVILITVALNMSIITVDNNHSFHAGYLFALFNRIPGYRIVKLHSLIAFHIVSIAMRFALLEVSDPLIIAIAIVLEIFTIYLSVQSEKGERALFDSLYKSKEQLIKFKDFMVAHMPHPTVFLDSSYGSYHFVNDAFKQSFKFEDVYDLKTCLKGFFLCPEHLKKNKEMLYEVGVTDEKREKPLSLSEFIWMISQKISFLRDRKVLVFRCFQPKAEPPAPGSPEFEYQEESDDFLAPRTSSKLISENKPLPRHTGSTIMRESYQDTNAREEITSGRVGPKANVNGKGKLVVCGTGIKRILEIKIFLLEWDGEETIVVMIDDTSKREVMTITNNSLANLMSSPALRLPLVNMLNSVDNLEKKINDTSLIPELKNWENNTKVLLNLTNSLLEATQAKQPKDILATYTQVSVQDVLQEVKSIFEPLCRMRGLFFKMESSPDLPESIMIDRHRLRQILVNVLACSMGSTAEGGITLNVVLQKQGIKHIRFTVEDTSKGLSKEKRKKLLQVIKQKELYGSNISSDDMNLGLVVSNILLEALNYINEQGLQVESETDRGNTITFVVPCHPHGSMTGDLGKDLSMAEILGDFIEDYQAEDEEEGLPMQNREAPCLSSGGENRLLFRNPSNSYRRTSDQKDSTVLFGSFNDRPWCMVVDDNAFNVMSAKSLLERRGYRVKIAMNGKDAIEQIKQHEKEGQVFKVILLDGEMPIMNGYETAKKIKTLMRTKEVSECPILGLIDEDEDQTNGGKMKEAGMSGCIRKPVDPSDIEGALKKSISF